MEKSNRVVLCSCFLFVSEKIDGFLSSTSPRYNSLIIAHRAKPGEFPFIVTISLEDTVLFPICSGAIVGPLTVLTAASCLGFNANLILKSLVVTAGTNYLNPNETTKVVQRHVANVAIHPKYKGAAMPHDLSIITVSKKFNFKPGQCVMQVPMAFVPIEDGTVCQILGWGLETNFAIHVANIPLKVTSVRIYNVEMCEFIYRVKIYRSQLCSERPSLYIGLCAADVGSALVCDKQLYGIGSIYSNCTNPMEPNIFTYMPSYKRYIIVTQGGFGFSSSAKTPLTGWTGLILSGIILK